MRGFSSARERARATAAADLKQRNQKMALYGSGLAILTLGVCYASVPLYKVFCAQTGFGGTTKRAPEDTRALLQPADTSRVIRVTFDGTVADTMPWSFVPAQRDVRVVPGESALAFYVTTNNAKFPITGVATYNVQPPQAGPYFVKIQCFCFDEQRLMPGEEVSFGVEINQWPAPAALMAWGLTRSYSAQVDMPVLFVIDPKFLEDPSLKRVSNITLSYNFFRTDDDEEDEEAQEAIAEARSRAERDAKLSAAKCPVLLAVRGKRLNKTRTFQTRT